MITSRETPRSFSRNHFFGRQSNQNLKQDSRHNGVWQRFIANIEENQEKKAKETWAWSCCMNEAQYSRVISIFSYLGVLVIKQG